MNGSNRLPILDLTDQDSTIAELRKKANQLSDGFVLLGIQYMNVITGRLSSKDNESYFFLRDSILFRLNCLIFHLRLLLDIQKNHLNQLSKTEYDAKGRLMLLINAGEQQTFLFDSMVFHSISLFDYVGNTIDFLCGGKKQGKLKWNGVVKSARDTNNRMSHFEVAPKIIEVNSKYVDRLYAHRSDLIHYKKDISSASETFNLELAKSDFVVYGPHRFVSNFPELKELSQTNRLTLNFVSHWLCKTSIDCVGEILTKLFLDLEKHRLIPRGQELIIANPK